MILFIFSILIFLVSIFMGAATFIVANNESSILFISFSIIWSIVLVINVICIALIFFFNNDLIYIPLSIIILITSFTSLIIAIIAYSA